MNIPSLEKQQNAVPSITTDDWREAYHAPKQETSLTNLPELTLLTAKIQKAEAELANWKEEAGRYHRNAEFWRSISQHQLSTLRTISEAGEVPAGCVRITGFYADGRWYLGTGSSIEDTHFADILLPVESTPQVVHGGPEALISKKP